MPWVTPKTDWYGETDANGNYTGDRFNAEDYNRIKNNLDVLHDLAIRVYRPFDIEDMGEDKQVGDYFYADEINAMEQNLELINQKTYNLAIGNTQTFEPNGYTMHFVELNRIESMTLEIHDLLMNQLDGRRMFTWNFGFKGGDF